LFRFILGLNQSQNGHPAHNSHSYRTYVQPNANFVVCLKCSKALPLDSNFCSRCGFPCHAPDLDRNKRRAGEPSLPLQQIQPQQQHQYILLPPKFPYEIKVQDDQKRKHRRYCSAGDWSITEETFRKPRKHSRRHSQPTLPSNFSYQHPQNVRRSSIRTLSKKDPLYKIKSKHRRIVSNGNVFSGASSDFGESRPYQNLMYKNISDRTTGDPFDEFGETPFMTKTRRFKPTITQNPPPLKLDAFTKRRLSTTKHPYLEEVAKMESTFQSKLAVDHRRKRRHQQHKSKAEGEQPGYLQPSVGGVLTASAEYSRSHSREPIHSETPNPNRFEGEPGALPRNDDSLRYAAELAGAETRTRRREKYVTRFGEQRVRVR